MRLPGSGILHAAKMGSVAAVYAVEAYGTQTFTYDADEFNGRFQDVFGERAF